MQRSRLLAAAVGAIEEYGYAQTTVAQITARSRVSRRTFYELFGDREQCLAALLEDVVAMVQGELAAAGVAGLPWRERVRGGLEAILAFCDREPALARVFVVHALRGGPEVLERREQVLAQLAGVLDEGRVEGSRASDCTPLTAEGLVGAALGILHARLTRGERMAVVNRKQPPLVSLSGELMGMIVLPYLGPAAARRELARPVQIPAASSRRPRAERALSERDPLQGVPMRLTYRTACVLQAISSQPGVSNREVAAQAGVADQGQISKLLARLERLGLTENTGDGHHKGEANAWDLTPLGAQVAQRLRIGTDHQSEAQLGHSARQVNSNEESER
ncbi:MAG TPA: TetR family transcriptional regulator [Solirubrobacteraceae bacterium]|jgi:AcrR family transcriptional regulator|nr:TetR family transcriptional regulator [Solirubrobacteraceae bacterium]